VNLVERLLSRAAERPGQPAIIEGADDRSTTFERLAERSARAAGTLAQSGVAAGEPVLFLAPMSAALYVWLLGTLRLGAVAMFLDPSAGRQHVSRCLRMLAPRAFVGSGRAHLLRLLIPELRRVSAHFHVDGWFESHLDNTSAREALTACKADDPALVTFTSGSTGEPKAVVRSHGFLLEQHRVLERALELRPGAVDLTTLPIFLLANLASGMTSVIPAGDLRRPGVVDARPILAQVARLRPESCGASPAFAERLCEAGELAPLKRFYVGGGPVFPNLIARLKARLPQGEVIAVYGSTEAEPIAHIHAGEIGATDYERMRGGGGLLAGKPIDEISLAVLPSRWGEPIGPFTSGTFKQLEKGQAGEIVVSGGHVVRGYLHGRGDAETKFDVDGVRWHRTGDLGRLDEEGRLWLLGRCAAAIRDARGALYPFAVECAAQQVEGVRRAALVLAAGRRVLAYEASGPVSLEGALAWAQLDEVRRVKAIPLDARHNAKVDYPALERLLAS
jgi:acyl-CoA synthetase (AMP-forming)/AMP-acid ligase II